MNLCWTFTSYSTHSNREEQMPDHLSIPMLRILRVSRNYYWQPNVFIEAQDVTFPGHTQNFFHFHSENSEWLGRWCLEGTDVHNFVISRCSYPVQGFLGYMHCNCITTRSVHNDILHFEKWASRLLNIEQIGGMKHTAICYCFIYTSNK